MKNEKITSLRLPEELKATLIKRYGSLRGAVLSLWELQLIADQAYAESLKKGKKK